MPWPRSRPGTAPRPPAAPVREQIAHRLGRAARTDAARGEPAIVRVLLIALVLLGLAAFLIVRLFGRPGGTAVTITIPYTARTDDTAAA